MAFPDDHGLVECHNFPESYRETLIAAIAEEQVTWVPGTDGSYAGHRESQFDFSGCRYRIVEEFESVVLIQKIGDIDNGRVVDRPINHSTSLTEWGAW